MIRVQKGLESHYLKVYDRDSDESPRKGGILLKLKGLS
jgi:hypothetical protein